MKILTTFALIALSLSSCRKCYDCKIVQTAPSQVGVQFQAIRTEVEVCGMSNTQLNKWIDEMESNSRVTVKGSEYSGSTNITCN